MYIDPSFLPAYLAAVVALSLSPGPDTMFVIANGLRGRLAPVLAAVLGIATGSLCHATAAALGISAVVAASPTAFKIVRLAGGAYLAVMGIRALHAALRGKGDARREAAPVRSFAAVYRNGLMTNLLNPKIIVFYLAFLPQFVSPALGHAPAQMISLGLMLNLIGSLYLVLVGYMTVAASARLLASATFGRWMDGVAGTIFIGLALRLVLGQRAQS